MAGQSPQWIMTARVLRRCGFGATGAEIDAVVGQNWPSYVDAALAADPDADRGALATPMPPLPPPRPPGRGATTAARTQYRRQLAEQNDQLTRWWLRRMVATELPLHEKLTLLWHNHFATSAQKVRIAAQMAAQNQKLRTLKLGDFRTLAYAMLTDAAMLRWLDGQLNTAKAPNENLAREFMELFTLGHNNGYTEDDVRAGARALTGWTINDDRAVLVSRRRDPGSKTLFGVTDDYDAAGFCDAVLARPGSAAHVAGRLWQQLVSDEPPSPPALERIVAAYGPRRDLKALTRAILTDDEFTGGRATVVNAPVEWLVGVIRALQPAEQHDKLIENTLKALGQRPFFPTDVNGWPSGQVWLSTASATTRLRTAARLARSADLSTIDSTGPGERIDAVGYLIGVGAWTDRTVEALQPLVRQPQRLVTAAVNTPEYLTS
ncbi:DUF1800 domain-containing protein [Mycobacterium sp. Z3061]|uniref:DUF1800 domain-containing protein n=1 Tax=Mycobacterium sp. Z3061 TaxID=3073562 RepID=UPI0028738C6C|nr:DUF1800 domain-containing protein [Mycobacterium sp. Z3061]